MGAALDDTPGFQHQNLVGIDHGRQPVRDHERGLVARRTLQLALDGALVGGVERRSGFVEDDDWRVFKQGAGDGHALLLAARKLEPPLADHGVVALGRGGDEVVDARRLGRRHHVFVQSPGAAVGDVVGHGVVEEHGVLRHDADGAAQARLRERANVVPGDGDAPAAHVVEAKQQARQGALAGPRGADHGHRVPRRDLEAEPLQDGPRALVAKAHVLEAHHRRRIGKQRLRVGCVLHLALALEQPEHLVEVGERLLEFAVNHAKKVERDVELDHEGVDHHQVAKCHAPGDHAFGRAPKHGNQRRGDQQLLAGVEQGERVLRLQARAAQLAQAFVVAAGLEALVVEVLDGFVVKQRVDRAAVRRGVELVHLLAKLRAPLGHGDGKDDVDGKCRHRDEREGGVELDRQQGEHEPHFHQRGHDAVERIRDERLHATRAALDVARHAPRLAFEVKAQAQRMQVLEHLQRNAARRAFGGLGEDQLARLGEKRGRQAQRAVGHQQPDGHHQHGAWVGRRNGERVDQFLEQQGHAHIGHLGGNQEAEGEHHARFVGPEIGQQPGQSGPVGARRRCRARGGAGRRRHRRGKNFWAHESQSPHG